MGNSPEKEMEYCILCKKQLTIPRSAHISERKWYIQGCGQMCRDCYKAERDKIAADRAETQKMMAELLQMKAQTEATPEQPSEDKQ